MPTATTLTKKALLSLLRITQLEILDRRQRHERIRLAKKAAAKKKVRRKMAAQSKKQNRG